jgi:hypothetical protein
MSTPVQHPKSPRMSTPVEHWETPRVATPVRHSEPLNLFPPSQHPSAPHMSTIAESTEPLPVPAPLQYPIPQRTSALVQRPELLRAASPALSIQPPPRITSPTPPAPTPTPHTIHAHASSTLSTTATREALMASIQASLDRHSANTPVGFNHARHTPTIRTNHARTVSAPLLSTHAGPRPPRRPRIPPPLNLYPQPSASTTSHVARTYTSASMRTNASASTTSLLAGPSAYVYTPLTARMPGFESFRDDHEIESPRRPRRAVLRVWDRVRGGR